MTTRSARLATLASLVLAAASCGPRSVSVIPGASSPVASPAPSETSSGAPGSPGSASPSTAPTASPGPLHIGLVTAIPSGEGAARDAATTLAVSNAAAEIGAPHEVIETLEDADYAPNIQSFVDHAFHIVVTVGDAAGPPTIAAARAAPDTWFIGVDQRACVTPAGDADLEGVCAGDAAALVPNYQGLTFAEDESAYLAGIVAANVSEGGVLGVVGGASVGWVVRSWRGFENGAHSVDPDADVRYLELAPDATGFGDAALGRTGGDQLVRDGANVLFQLAGESGPGVIDAACAAGIRAIGSVVDQARALPDLGCLVTSAEKRFGEVVAAAVERAAQGDFRPGTLESGLGEDPAGVGLSPITGGVELSSDESAILEAASRALAAGTLDPCAPMACTVSGS